MTGAEREQLIERYEAGPALIREALAKVPDQAMQWRPASGKWSVHEVVCHCADSETVSATRVRYLVGESNPTIVGYDQDTWAQTFDYHGFPLDLALDQVETVRRWTAAFIRGLPEQAWSRSGTHTEMPGKPYTAEGWLGIYADHLEIHARQILRNVEAWKNRKK